MFSREQRGFHRPARGAQDQFLGIFGGFVGDEEGSDFILTATLFVPYFGTISLQSGRDKSAARAATDHTGSIAYKDSNPSSQNEIQQRHAIHDSFSALDTISTSYHAIMPSIARRPNAQCGAVSPNQNQRSQSAVHNQPEVSLRWLCTAVASGCVGCGFVVQPLYNYAKTPN